MLVIATGSGLLITAVSIEEALTVRNYIRSDVAKYAIGLLVALVGYMCRRAALDEVNAVFHVDPGPLPMTVWAGTALNLARVAFKVFFVVAGAASLVVFFSPRKRQIASQGSPPASLVGLWGDEIVESTAWVKLVAEASAMPPPGWRARLWIGAKMMWARSMCCRRLATLRARNAFRGWDKKGPNWERFERGVVMFGVIFSSVVGIAFVSG